MAVTGASKMRVAIIGKGNVGSALGAGLQKAGHEVRFGHRGPAEPVDAAAKWGEVIILAVPHENADNARAAVKPYADGKTVVDVMNAMGMYDIERNACWMTCANLLVALTDAGVLASPAIRSHLLMVKTHGLYCLAM